MNASIALAVVLAVPAYHAPVYSAPAHVPASRPAPVPRTLPAPVSHVAPAPHVAPVAAPRVAPLHSSSRAVQYVPIDIPSQGPLSQLLATYGLTPAYCGLPNVVVIWGPGATMTCAYSNQSVAAGTYQLNPATLTLIPQAAPP